MRNFRSTSLLFLLAAIIGGWIWWREREPVASKNRQIVWHFNADQVRQIRWQTMATKASKTAPQSTLSLQKIGDSWTVKQSGRTFAAEADPQIVRRALERIATLQSESVQADSGAKRREFGLERPQSTLSVDNQTLEFGASFPLDRRRIYARVGNQIALLPAALTQVFARPFDDWRDRRVVHFAKTEISSFQIKAPLSSANLGRSAPADQNSGRLAQWTIEKPGRARADAGSVDALLGTLESATIEQFLDDHTGDKKRWNFNHPRAYFAWKTSDGQSDSLAIGAAIKGGYSAKTNRSPRIFRVSSTLLAALNRPLREWRDKVVLPLEVNAVTKIDIIWKTQRATLFKNGGAWKISGGITNANAEETALRAHNSALELLGAVQTLRARDFASRNYPVTAVEPLELRLVFGPSNQNLNFFHHKGKLCATASAPRGFDDPLYLLPDDALKTFQAPLQRIFRK